RSPGDPVAELGPGAESSQLGDLRIACKPGFDLLRAFLLAGPGVFPEGEGMYGHPHGSSPGLLGAPGRGEEWSHSLDRRVQEAPGDRAEMSDYGSPQIELGTHVAPVAILHWSEKLPREIASCVSKKLARQATRFLVTRIPFEY